MKSIDIYRKMVQVLEDKVGCKVVALDMETPIVRPSMKLDMEESHDVLNEIVSSKDLTFRLIYFAEDKVHKETENKRTSAKIAELLKKPIQVGELSGVWAGGVDFDRTATGELVAEWKFEYDFDEDYSDEENAEMLEEIELKID
jgi:hypothetical protein